MPGTRRHTEYMPLDAVLRAPRNPKQHDRDLIAGSMAYYGVVELPTLDERTGRLVAGHGRLDEWERARDTGQTPPDGIDVDADGRWLVPVTRGWASESDADAERYLLVSNRSTELGGYDNDTLVSVLVDLRNDDDTLLHLTGYQPDDVDDLIRLTQGEDDHPPKPMPDPFGTPDVDTWETITIKAPDHVAAAWRIRVAERDGVDFKALADLMGIDPLYGGP